MTDTAQLREFVAISVTDAGQLAQQLNAQYQAIDAWNKAADQLTIKTPIAWQYQAAIAAGGALHGVVIEIGIRARQGVCIWCCAQVVTEAEGAVCVDCLAGDLAKREAHNARQVERTRELAAQVNQAEDVPASPVAGDATDGPDLPFD